MERKWNSGEQSRPTQITRFRLYIGCAVLLAIASACLYSRLRKPEPVYQGKTSAQWFQEFEKASSPPLRPANVIVSVSSNLSVLRLNSGVLIRVPGAMRLLDTGGPQRERALGALRALGTNAGIYLGREFLREDGTLAPAYWKLHSKTPAGIRKFLPKPAVPRNVVREHIAAALNALGKDAAPAVPAIVTVLSSGEPSKIRSAVHALGGIPLDPRLLEPVLEDWSQRGQSTNVYEVVSDLPLRTSGAAGSLGRVLRTGNAAFRRSCEYELEHFGPAAITALPELTAALADNDAEIRYGAARALEKIGPGAAPAMPALMRATNDESILVRRASARALVILRGQAPESP